MSAAGEPSLKVDALLAAYARGWFPMDRSGAVGPVGFYEADPRAVIPIESFRVPRSVARGLRRRRYEIRVDAAVEKFRDSPSEVRVPLTTAAAGKPQSGRQYVQSLTFQLP